MLCRSSSSFDGSSARGYPRLLINLNLIEDNTRLVCRLAAAQAITITAVTKACCGSPEIAAGMLRGGVKSFGDSRMRNLRRLRDAGIRAELWLLRTPMLSEVEDVVQHADVSLNSELEVIASLSEAAIRRQVRHRIVLMVEMGDLREGICREDLPKAVEQALRLNGVNLWGIGMNLACLGGVVPTPEKIDEFLRAVEQIERIAGRQLEVLSGGNSANMMLLLDNETRPTRINHLRIGEAILLGRESVARQLIPGAHGDAFTLECELIELKDKPSLPFGELSQNAYGSRPVFKDLGTIRRGLLAIGRQDVLVDGLTPLDPAVTILGASSDHIAVHVQSTSYHPGDIVRFRLNYGALAQVFISEYVSKVMI